MIIDFEKTEEKVVENFKGGNGKLIMRAADDGKVKIMRNILTPGSSIGMHTHEGNCEVMYIIKGEITFVCDGKERPCAPERFTTARADTHIAQKTAPQKTPNSSPLCRK